MVNTAMIYAYRCRKCSTRLDSSERFDERPCLTVTCPGALRRDYSMVQLAPVMQEHYNHSVGRAISDTHQLDEHFKRSSDEYSAKTGIEARFAPLDPKDAGATGEGLEATNRQRKARGMPTLKE